MKFFVGCTPSESSARTMLLRDRIDREEEHGVPTFNPYCEEFAD